MESEWIAHKQDLSHIERDQSAEPVVDEIQVPSVRNTQELLGHSEGASEPVYSKNASTRPPPNNNPEEFLPDSFFDESSENQEVDDLETTELKDEPLSENVRIEMESNIRQILQKRPRETKSGSEGDDDDFDWRRKRL